MKLTVVLLVASFLQVSANGYSQKISIKQNNLGLEELLLTISKQTGYSYSVNYRLLEKIKPTNLDIKDVSISQALSLFLNEQPYSYLIKDSIIFIKEYHAILIDTKGTIKNEEGIPIIATITVKGTQTSVSTDSNGEFLLKNIEENAILVVTGVNIESLELIVNGRKNLGTISVKSKVTLGKEVIIEANTGYQTLKPNETNGSIVLIDNKTLNQQTGTNILQRLDGVTSGLLFNVGKLNSNPQNKTNIVIRGHSTINGPLDPLIILDNFPYEGNIDNINPNDIESITVLKDAAAASIWGARAGNGVIVITTKKAKLNQKLRIDLNSNLIIQKSPDLFSIPEMTIDEYINIEEYLFNKGYFNSTITNNTTRPGLAPASAILLLRRNGAISSADSAIRIDNLKNIDSRNEYNKYFYQDAITQQYSLNLRGGSNNIAWTISANYDKNITNLKSKANKANFRLNNTYAPLKNLQINFAVYYTNSISEGPDAPSYSSIKINARNVPYLKFATEDGIPISVASYYRETYTDTAGVGKLLDWKYYPLNDYKHIRNTSKLEDITANINITYQMLKNLNFRVSYQNQRQKTTTENFSGIESFYTRDLINRFSQLNRSTGIVTNIIPKGNITQLLYNNTKSQNIRGQLNYFQTWHKHSITSIAGMELGEKEIDGNDLTYYGYNEDPLKYATVDFLTRYPAFNRTITTNIPGAPKFRRAEIARFVSLYVNGAYTFKNKYSVNGSMRRDGSNVLGATTNNKWKPLWSLGAGWEVSKEKFFNTYLLSYLKLRYSLGYSGNIDLSKIPLPIGTYSNSSVTNLPFMTITQINDPSLRWEKVKQTNWGIDFSIKNQILSGSIEYYKKVGLDLYGPSPFNYTSGFNRSSINKNVANMQGKGIDIVLRSKNIDRIFKWSTNFLLNYRSEKTTKYFNPNALSSNIKGGNLITPVVGKPLYSIAAFKWGGLNSSGDPQGFLNGQLSTDYSSIFQEINQKGTNGENLVYIGSAVPKLFGSLLNTLSYKGISVTVNFTYKFNYYFIRPSLSYNKLFSEGIGHSEFSNRWKNPGDENYTNVPGLVYTDYSINGVSVFDDRDYFYVGSEINVVKGDHIRLQFINLNYTLEYLKKKSVLQNIDFYLNIANCGVIWSANKENLDPDYSSVFSPSKTYTIGLRAGF